MTYIVDTTKENEINLDPATVYEEVIQNLYFLYSSTEYDIPLDRGLGLSGAYIDKPIDTAKALATINIYDKTEEYEPRAEIVNIDFEADYERGILKPIVEVEINDEYDNEEYTE
ncbi:hypothetical protein E5329_18675 [Petralouisia muris]|uniref:Uncharacterized protein n=1 Tax=Petralouisia muris TaxID=3032872 RepID=A0AC61RSA3_9FIRM|nr:hypothetical protein [Petralouisia muris]TGY93443.1 hypothetical protein E5329_18675 [Petralouisia muris]